MKGTLTRRLLILGGFAVLAMGFLARPQLQRTRMMHAVSETKQILTAIEFYALGGDVPLPADLKTLFTEIDQKEMIPLAANYDFLTPGANLNKLPPGTPVIRYKKPIEGKWIVGCAGGQVRPERNEVPTSSSEG